MGSMFDPIESRAIMSRVAHLPDRKQHEVERIVRILRAYFAKAVTQPRCDQPAGGTILKILLCGSHARGDWLDDWESDFWSDYDFLVVVDHDEFTDEGEYWDEARGVIFSELRQRCAVDLVIRSLGEVNDALGRGHSFFVDLLRDGIPLYEVSGHAFVRPPLPLPATVHLMAAGYFAQSFSRATDALARCSQRQCTESGSPDWPTLLREIHRVVERLYLAFLSAHMMRLRPSTDLGQLRTVSEHLDPRLTEAWPRHTRQDRQKFELLRRSQPGRRRSMAYGASNADVEAILESVARLHRAIEAAATEHLANLCLLGMGSSPAQ